METNRLLVLQKEMMDLNKTYLLLWGLALILTIIAYQRSPALAYEGAVSAGRLFLSVLPGLLAGFLLGGMIQVLIPKDIVVSLAGADSGWQGLLIGTLGGMILPGGPFVQFPVVASFWKAGAAVGPLMAYVSAWLLLGLNRVLVWEVPILGWRFVLVRFSVSLIVPPLLGLLAGMLFSRISRI